MNEGSNRTKAMLVGGLGILLALTSGGPAAAQACAEPPAGLVSWWPADGHALDIADGNNGTLQNGATFGPGKVGQAFTLDGVDDFVRVVSPTNVDLSGTFTFAAWFKTTSTGNATLLRYNNLLTGRGFICQVGYAFTGGGNGQLLCDVYAPYPSNWARGISNAPVNNGVYHHVALVRSIAGVVKLYIDGAYQPTTIFPFQPTPPGNALIGDATAAGADFTIGHPQFETWAGEVDEVAYFEGALSDTQILAIYNTGSTGKCKLPLADAGVDQTVDEGSLVALTGSGLDPLGKSLTFTWTQVGGPSVTLSDPSMLNPTFTAPSVPAGGAVLSFQLVAMSSLGSGDPDTVNITIKNVNHPPVAETTGDFTVPESSLVTLDGSPSYDVDDEPLTYLWTQTAGTLVTLSGGTTAIPSFTAPSVGSAGETLTFSLVVHDGIDESASALVNVNVTNVNQVPTANAGADASAPENTQVYLAGSGSDPDGDALTFDWNQTGGTSVVLSNPTSPSPSFWAPFVNLGGETLTFSLVVRDGFLDSAADEVTITILNTNDPPSCASTSATLGQLWPPNHKLIEVGVTGVVDPQGDTVSVLVTSVTSDEPTSGLGDGDSSPDAVIQGDTVLLRAERWDQGDGRVYAVRFTATDVNGESCTGAVRVGVPKSMKKGSSATDGGQAYDATMP